MNDISLDIKIYAVGSNEVLTSEIKEALRLIFEKKVPVHSCEWETLCNHMDGSLYVCNKSQEEQLLRYISREKIRILNLTPVSQFYLKLAAIPTGSDVYVFNNKKVYIETLIHNCYEMGLDKLNFIPIPYSEMPEETVFSLLQQAHYIVGVDILLREVLCGEKYKGHLRADLIQIGAKRVASVNCSMDILTTVNTLIKNQALLGLDELAEKISLSAHEQSLYTYYTKLEAFLKLGTSLFPPEDQDRKVADSVFRSALNQLSSE